MKPAIVYTTGHVVNESISKFLVQGFNAEKRPACIKTLESDGSTTFHPVNPKLGTLSIFYGILRGTGNILLKCEATGEDYLYCDHSYFALTRADGPERGRVTQHGYFRLVPNGRQYTHLRDMPADRWNALGLTLKPWRKHGSHVVLVPVSRYVAGLYGLDAGEWLKQTQADIRQVTDRQIVVKPKDSEGSLEAVLKDAWALVAMESNAALDALIAGIPVFVGKGAAAASLGSLDLADMERPRMPLREQHFANLAYQQWTLSEIKSGMAAAILEEQSEEKTLLRA